MKTVIIGGGAAGMMAAIASKESGNDVVLIEKMNTLGRKLLITGKGRCNITSSLPISDFIQNVPGNGKFLYSAFGNFTNTDIINFLKSQGVQVKVERGNRVFPVSDKSMDVLGAFESKIKELGIKVLLGTQVKKINVDRKTVIGVQTSTGKNIDAEKVIVATGGKSYPLTGSNGDGYEFAKKMGHTITNIKPSLVPLEVTDSDLKIVRQLQGLSLKNVQICMINKQDGKIFYEDFGEMIFTHFGVSGPIILSASAHLNRQKNIEELLKNNKIELQIDLKPALSIQKLDLRVIRDFEKEKNKILKNSLNDLLPLKMINTVISLSKIDENKKVNEITRNERQNLINILKKFTLQIKSTRPIEEAIITSGGVDVREINPKTMESKIIKGLYFAGEVIDVDAYTGGFNLQIAFSTGYSAGISS
ncbi:MAG: NAD(P)/FAD-dependent oxidoreductase [Clostridia bacterium]|nr:NAD(P)/FAD-dependent oxidoreductase [Clostridia bacterium]